MGGRLARYLTSRRNLAGCALALLGLGLAIADPVGPGGLLLVAGFYGLGVAAVPKNRSISRYGFDPEHVERALRDEIAAVSGQLPPEIFIRIQRIELVIRREILPRLDQLPPGSFDLYLVERTAGAYLPTALKHYLRLPASVFSPSGAAASARDVLIDQLRLMEAEMRRIAEGLHQSDMDRLLAHRRFLNDRFGRLDSSA
jgi:hypothetical protein